MKSIGWVGLVLCMLALGPRLLWAGPVNINTADAAALAHELSGVGPALAEAIIKDREQNGPFTSPESLSRVKGIGQRIIELNKSNILVSDPSSPKR
jgi:competence protein ComEA